MSETEKRFSVALRQLDDYQFVLDFGEFGDFLSDEAPPLGGGEGPNPSRLLAAATANCLAASLLFALRKYKNDPGTLRGEVSGELTRNEDGRWRIKQLDVNIELGVDASELDSADKALAQFEDFCIVTQSIREGIPVAVTVADAAGKVLREHRA